MVVFLDTAFVLSLILETEETDIVKPNDALIAATCKHYGIKNIATFDSDFKGLTSWM